MSSSAPGETDRRQRLLFATAARRRAGAGSRRAADPAHRARAGGGGPEAAAAARRFLEAMIEPDRPRRAVRRPVATSRGTARERRPAATRPGRRRPPRARRRRRPAPARPALPLPHRARLPRHHGQGRRRGPRPDRQPRLRRLRPRRDDAGRERLRPRPAGCARRSSVPILMLTARADAKDRVRGPRDRRGRLPAQALRAARTRAAPQQHHPPHAPSALASDAPAQPEFVRFGPFIYRLDKGELRQGEEIIRHHRARARDADDPRPRARRDGAARGAGRLAASCRTSARSTSRSTGCAARSRPIPANPLLLQTVRGSGYRLVVE